MLEILQRPEIVADGAATSPISSREGLHEIMALYPDFFIGMRQSGVVMGLEFRPSRRRQAGDAARSTKTASGRSSRRSIQRVLQFKPGVLMTAGTCQEHAGSRSNAAIGRARANHAASGRQGGVRTADGRALLESCRRRRSAKARADMMLERAALGGTGVQKL